MPKENDLEGRQDMGGRHGGQAGMPKPETISGAQQGIVKDEKGQEQPADKERAQRAGVKEQKDAVESSPESPGEPEGGE
jgi:hypothetical protein